MNNIKIETLTSVHIGSGVTYKNGADFVKGIFKNEDDKYSVIGIIDPDKILKLIGEEHIQNWVSLIEKNMPTNEIVNLYAPLSEIAEYSKRIIMLWDEKIRNNDTLKEYIINGNGVPYIPGSSIKGAIRTSILSSILAVSKDLIKEDLKRSIKGTDYEKFFIGKDPNCDFFRFIKVGDAHFDDCYTDAIRMVNINHREEKSFWDLSSSQLIEVLGPGNESTFSLHIDMKHNTFATSKSRDIKKIPNCASSINQLFITINEHTQTLLKEEIELWDEYRSEPLGKVAEYIAGIEELIKETESCDDGKSCILRVGHGSGWRFITGAWSEENDNFSYIISRSRPNNERYLNYEFPKTRRLSTECELLGFVKLTIV